MGTEKTHELDTLDGLVANTVRFAQSMYEDNKDPGYELMPMFSAISLKHKKHFVIMTPFIGASAAEIEEGKNKLATVLKLLFACEDVSHYVMLSEAWVAGYDERTHPELAGIPAGEREDRREMLFAMGASSDGRKLWRSFEIERDDAAIPSLGKETAKEGVTDFKGRFATLLDVPPMPEELKADLRKKFEKAGIEINQTTYN